MTDKLIAYFSASGITKNVSENLANTINADLFEIEPEVKYTPKDLDWTNKESRSTKEMNDKTFRPPIKSTIDISNYKIIFIGFPVWWYTAPTIINTFIESIKPENKTFIPFCTSGGTGIEGCQKDLEQNYPNINWLKGKKLINGNQSEIKNWNINI